jgi:hypothetical protein
LEELIDPLAPDTLTEAPDAPDTDPNDSKAKNRAGYDQRKQQTLMDQLVRENEGYKRREDEARRATLSEVQRLTEERDGLRAERDRESAQRLRERVAREYRLPEAFSSRLVGTDEEALRADAEELAKLLPRQKVGSVSDPVRETTTSGRTYRTSDISDRAFFLAHKADIELAGREGRITPD